MGTGACSQGQLPRQYYSAGLFPPILLKSAVLHPSARPYLHLCPCWVLSFELLPHICDAHRCPAGCFTGELPQSAHESR